MTDKAMTSPYPALSKHPEGNKAPTTEEMIKLISGATPHSRELGLQVVHSAKGMAIMRLPWQERLVGNPDELVLHGGVVTTLLDSVCGMATMSARQPPERIVTLDLRIDYQRPATPHVDLFARAEVTRQTRTIAFLSAVAYQDDPKDMVALATGTFMFVGRRRKKDAEGGKV
ncbi:MAG: PaaI family thioesterase [Rhodospirillaceae bacterium]|nr:PaaI family thioesterase [Rhodospirillaceae bacterium]